MTHMHELKTFVITTFPSLPAFFTAVQSPSSHSVLIAIIMPCVFFAISKTVDIVVQLWIKPWLERRRAK